MKRLLIGFSLFLAGLCHAAPAPLPKPIPKIEAKHLAGNEFQWEYGGGTGVYVFQNGDTFYCTLGGTRYYGTWTYKDGVLRTKETLDGQLYNRFDYAVEFKIDHRGRLLAKPVNGRCNGQTDVKFWSPKALR